MTLKTTDTTDLKIGNVIVSPEFFNGTLADDTGLVVIGGHKRRRGKASEDSTRGMALFLITRIFSQSETEGGISCDCWSEKCAHTSEQIVEWVEAVRLTTDGKIHGETIRFARSSKTEGEHIFAPIDKILKVTKLAEAGSISVN